MAAKLDLFKCGMVSCSITWQLTAQYASLYFFMAVHLSHLFLLTITVFIEKVYVQDGLIKLI